MAKFKIQNIPVQRRNRPYEPEFFDALEALDVGQSFLYALNGRSQVAVRGFVSKQGSMLGVTFTCAKENDEHLRIGRTE